MNRTRTLETSRPDLVSELLTSLPQECNPFFCCMVVTSRRTITGELKKPSSKHQCTNIYIARQPFELVERLNRGQSIAEVGARNLATRISKLLPQRSPSPSPRKKPPLKKPKPSPPPPTESSLMQDDEDTESSIGVMLPDDEEEETTSKNTEPTQQPAIIAVTSLPNHHLQTSIIEPTQQQQQQSMTVTGVCFARQIPLDAVTTLSFENRCEEWILRAVAAIGFSDSCELANEIERGECHISAAIERLELLRRTLVSDAASITSTNVSRLNQQHEDMQHAQLPIQASNSQIAIITSIDTPMLSALSAANSLSSATLLPPIIRRPDTDRKRRRRQLNKKLNNTIAASSKKTRRTQQPNMKSATKKGRAINSRSNGTKNQSAKLKTKLSSVAKHSSRANRESRHIQRLGMILGPILTQDAAELVGVVWGLKARGSIPRSALGEIMAQRFHLNLYADLAVVFEGEDFQRNVLQQTESGELWLVDRTKSKRLLEILTTK